MIYLIATLKIRPGTAAEVAAAAAPCIEGTRREPGCVSYDLHASLTDPATLVFVERWKTQADIDAHMKMPHFLAWREKAKDLILGRELEIITPADVKKM
jgi:quinol monooxygenase YgiN